ncbi:MAG: hypothetical protein ABR874_15245 [Candidatus Sulfotelmatobacter sp.]
MPKLRVPCPCACTMSLLIVLYCCAGAFAQVSPQKPGVPISAGNWSQIAELVSTSSQPLFSEDSLLGNEIAISGDTIVVSNEVPDYQPSGAAAFIFQKPASGWSNLVAQATLFVPENFVSITGTAISGDTAALCSTTGAYVFVKPAGGWANMSPTAKLTSTDGGSCDIVYGTLSMSGDTIVMGSMETDSNLGAAYVFVKPAGGWIDMTQTAKLTASDAAPSTLFGYSTTISGDTIMVGRPGSGVSGKVYVYVEPPSGWADMTETAQLTAPAAPKKAEIGTGLSLDNDTVLVASFIETAYIFTKPAGGWKDTTPTATLTPADGPSGQMGIAVGLSGNIAAVGAPFRGNSINQRAGGIYIFKEPNGGWKNTSSNVVLTPSNAHYFSELGESVAVQGNLVIGGAPFTMNWQGSAYIYELP